MARKPQPRASAAKSKRSVTRIVLYVISLLIVLSMTIGFVIEVFTPPPGAYQVATPTPFLLPTVGPSSP